MLDTSAIYNGAFNALLAAETIVALGGEAVIYATVYGAGVC